MPRTSALLDSAADYSTLEVAKLLRLAVRSVQLMVDRGELIAWKTPGGHRRIARESLRAWMDKRGRRKAEAEEPTPSAPPRASEAAPRRALLIVDSLHCQKRIAMIFAQQFPELELHVAANGIVGLAKCGELKPAVLLVDMFLPGIDAATLIGGLRSDAHFAGIRLIVISSLDDAQRLFYADLLGATEVVSKANVAAELPPILRSHLGAWEGEAANTLTHGARSSG